MSATMNKQQLEEASKAYNTYMEILYRASKAHKLGKYIIMATASGGNVVMNYAGGDTPQEALFYAGLDIVGAVVVEVVASPFVTPAGATVINIALINADLTLGSIVRDIIEKYKTPLQYAYVKDFEYYYINTDGNKYYTGERLDYAKLRIDPYSGEILYDIDSNGIGYPKVWTSDIFEYNENRTKDIDELEQEIIAAANAIELDTKISKINGVLYVEDIFGNTGAIAEESNVTISTGSGTDYIIASYGNSTIESGNGDDDIHAEGKGNKLKGGIGYDTYFVNDGDIIEDSDGKGVVYFCGIKLQGGEPVKDKENEYKGTNNNETYIYDKDLKTLTVQFMGNTLTIENFTNKDLEIALGDSIYAAIKFKGSDNEKAVFMITLSDSAEFDIEVSYSTKDLSAILGEHYKDTNNGKIIIEAGNKEAILEFEIIAKEEESKEEGSGCEAMKEGLNFKVIFTDIQIINAEDTENTQEDEETNIKIQENSKEVIGEMFGGGKCNCKDECMCGDECSGFDPNKVKKTDPLVLDIDKDGKISTVTIQDSEVYFDINGDGLKERVSWLNSNDAFLVYDRNENGEIDGINELFGNKTKNGFDELKETADSNYDNIIDKKDILFNRLKLWQDFNQNGKVDEGELKSLSELGVKSIDLNGGMDKDMDCFEDSKCNEIEYKLNNLALKLNNYKKNYKVVY